MAFVIRMGLPRMEEYWQDLVTRYKVDALSKKEFKTTKPTFRS